MSSSWSKTHEVEEQPHDRNGTVLSTILSDSERQQPDELHMSSRGYQCSHSEVVNTKDTRFLDGLRGVAALCVFNQHLMSSTEHHHGFAENGHYYFISLPFIRVFYSGGAAAVAIFFALSGFVLSQSAIRMIENQELRKCKSYLLAAVIRRPIRLYLPCFCVTLGLALLMHMPFNIYPEVPWGHRQPSLISEISHWLFESIEFFNPFREHAWKNGSFSYDLILWTIPIELKGSMLIYCLCAIPCFVNISPTKMTVFLLGFTIISLQMSWWSGACFIGGLALSVISHFDLDIIYIYSYLGKWSRSWIAHVLFIFGYYLLCQPASDNHVEVSSQTPGWKFLSSLIPRTYDGDNYYRFFHSYGAILFLHATLHLHWTRYLFSMRLLLYLGQVSFMLYILHWPIIICMDRVRRVFGGGGFLPETYWSDNLLYIPDIGPRGLSLRWILEWIIILSLTISIAHIATTYIERPAQRVGKFYAKNLGLI